MQVMMLTLQFTAAIKQIIEKNEIVVQTELNKHSKQKSNVLMLQYFHCFWDSVVMHLPLKV